MPLATNILKAKAQGFCTAIERMSEKARTGIPSKEVGEDYNSLRKLVLEAHPDLAQVMPPEARVGQNAYGGVSTLISWSTIDTFCQQIVNMLDA